MTGALPPAIVIAAGGAGQRMGGNKPERLLAGRRLLDHVLDWARASSDCLALAGLAGANADPEGLPVLADAAAGLGPIAALASAFAFAAQQGREQVVLVACDMPLLPVDLVPRLQVAIGSAAVAMPRRAGYLHPLPALWRVDPAGLERWIGEGGRAPRDYARAAGMVAVDWPGGATDPFFNVNTPDDLAAAEAQLRTAGR